MSGFNEKICGGGIHHVAIKVYDFDRSIKFYTEGLGFREKISWKTSNNNSAAMLDTGDGSLLEIYAGGHEEPLPQTTLRHIALKTDDCDTAVECARSAGAEITMEPTDAEIRGQTVLYLRIAFCKGPDGEVIEFFQQK